MRNKKTKPVIIGVTGSFGSGKSAAAKIFKGLGVFQLDADKLAHRELEAGKVSHKKIIEVFGRSILGASAKIKRAKLAKIVFADKRALSKLCAIIHPPVIKKIEKSIRREIKSGNASAIVIDAPLLIEAGLHNKTDFLIVVKTAPEIQVKRVMKKTGLNAREIARRIKNQMPLSRKLEMADYIVDNSGSKKKLESTVKKIWEEIKSGRK